MVSFFFFFLCNGMCKSKYIHCVVFLFLEFHEDLHMAFSVVYRPPPAFGTPSVTPSPSKRAPALVGTPEFSPPHWPFSTQAQTQLCRFIVENACDLAILPLFRKQVLASLTKNEGRKMRFLKQSIFSQPKPTCLWCCIPLSVVLLTSDLGEKITSDVTVMCSQVPFPFVLVGVEIKTIYLGYIYHSVFHCVSFAKVEDGLPCLCK
ncbi:hypothetical protein HJG60_007787 [Phyllostomus discolor]|uniref:Uncharacterized protein n=1 Tax=Phyllostomus discolor TaxID=89673 RepID=A0A834BHF2_9CHIR|nr:hypothetical protein HJG60_007787 [Phyllostomus discolor]